MNANRRGFLCDRTRTDADFLNDRTYALADIAQAARLPHPSPQLWLVAHSPSAWGPWPLPRPQKEDSFSLRGFAAATKNAFCSFRLVGGGFGVFPSRAPKKTKLQGRGLGGGVRQQPALRQKLRSFLVNCTSPETREGVFVAAASPPQRKTIFLCSSALLQPWLLGIGQPRPVALLSPKRPNFREGAGGWDEAFHPSLTH